MGTWNRLVSSFAPHALVKVSSSEAELRAVDQKEAAEKLARVVAQGGAAVERLALRNNREKPHFR